MKKTIFWSIVMALCTTHLSAQNYKFDFTGNKNVKEGYIKITPDDRYSEEKGYGYDLLSSTNRDMPFFFSVNVPDGNYQVTAIIGNHK